LFVTVTCAETTLAPCRSKLVEQVRRDFLHTNVSDKLKTLLVIAGFEGEESRIRAFS
jgi:hypothetical protein